MAIIDLANPTRFLRFAHRAHPWLMEITAAAFVSSTAFRYASASSRVVATLPS